jgi:hypothetical protein
MQPSDYPRGGGDVCILMIQLIKASHRPHKRTCRIRESEIVRYLSYWFPKRDEDPWPEGEMPF